MKKLLLILLLMSCCAFAETEFKIITLQHLFASDLLPIIAPMVGTDGAANGMNNQLIVRATPERMLEIEAIVAKLDVTRVNHKITVKSSNNVQSQQERTEATGAVKVGKVTIGNDSGRNDRHAKPNSGRVDVDRNSSNSSQNSNQFVSVLDGERAFIKVGQIVPFTQEWLTITRRYMQIVATTDWREISTGFAVRPHTIGDPNNKQVALEITPRIAKLNGNGTIDFEDLKTIVNVKLGDWVDIGGTMQTNDDVSRKILGVQSVSSQQQSSLVIKVE